MNHQRFSVTITGATWFCHVVATAIRRNWLALFADVLAQHQRNYFSISVPTNCFAIISLCHAAEMAKTICP
jgi:hypothetical protein